MGGSYTLVPVRPASSETEKALQLELCRFGEVVETAFAETAPHRICQYMYDLSDAFNNFYLVNKIIAEEDREKQGRPYQPDQPHEGRAERLHGSAGH